MNEVSDQGQAVAANTEDSLEMTVRDPAMGKLSVKVTDLNINECEFFCSADTPLLLPLGGRAELCFTTSVLDEPLEIKARVINRSEVRKGRRYRIRFPQLHKLPASVYALFNRRSSYRVKPPSGAIPSAQIQPYPVEASGRAVGAAVRDISITGISLELGAEHETELVHVDTVMLDIQIPRITRELRFIGKIRNRRLQDDLLVYGMAFNADASDDFLSQQALINDYVLSLLETELKKSGVTDSRMETFL